MGSRGVKLFMHPVSCTLLLNDFTFFPGLSVGILLYGSTFCYNVMR
jgi:hypothetical protein